MVKHPLLPSRRDFAANFIINRCSKLFYTISTCYFRIENTFSGASVSLVLSHIARYAPSSEENSCIPITHFQCKNNFEHLLNFAHNIWVCGKIISYICTTKRRHKGFIVTKSASTTPQYLPNSLLQCSWILPTLQNSKKDLPTHFTHREQL